MGVTIEGAPTAAGPEAFEVLRANAEALDAWLALETQWRCLIGPSGAVLWLGLDYGAADVVLRRRRWADPDQVFADLQVMEGAALEVLWKDGR